MNKARVTERHERTIVRTFGRAELEEIVRKALYEELTEEERWPAEPKVTIRFEDETEGSPSYRVGTKATIEVVITLDPEPA